MSDASEIERLADETNFSEEAVRAMADAIRSGSGSMAQFRHPEFGGSGQWSSGGMLMIGDMFNDGLKARVRMLADKAASSLSEGRLSARDPNAGAPGSGGRGQWWHGDFGEPSSSGAQNGMRYAVFPEAERLAIDVGGKVSVRDTGEHKISGVSQQQGGTTTLRFVGQIGSVDASDFPVVGEAGSEHPRSDEGSEASQGEDADDPAASKSSFGRPASPKIQGDDPLDILRRLAELKAEGILTEEEFSSKKADLLGRL